MNNQIEQTLQPLIDLPLWSIGRAGSLVWFAFGKERREVSLRDGTKKIISEYALHIQCAWRIRQRNKIIVASGDLFYPPGDRPYDKLQDFDWDGPGGNQLDQRVSKLLDRQNHSLIMVLSIKADETGNICLALNQEYFLDVFPDNSITSEYWRFFKPYSEDKHFVFTTEGIEFE